MKCFLLGFTLYSALQKHQMQVPFWVWSQNWSINDIPRRGIIFHTEQLCSASAPWGSCIYCKLEHRKWSSWISPRGIQVAQATAAKLAQKQSYNALFWQTSFEEIFIVAFVVFTCYFGRLKTTSTEAGNADKWLITAVKAVMRILVHKPRTYVF